MTRLKAFSIHLAISVAIFAALLSVIVFVWYPAPFFATDGGWQGLRIILTVDIILGPILTLIIFNPKKERRQIRFDLTVIGIVQLLALLSGTYIVHHERPVAKVIADGVVSPVTEYELNENNLNLDEIQQYRNNGTITIYTDLPDDFNEMQKVLLQSVSKRRPLYLFTEKYTKLDQTKLEKLAGFSINMKKYLQDNEKGKKIFNDFLAAQNRQPDEFLFLPLHSRYARTIVVLDRQTAQVIDVLNGISSPGVAEIDNFIQFKREYRLTPEEEAAKKAKKSPETQNQ